MWVLAFKTGKFIDKGGSPRSFTRTDLERIASRYDPRWHEAPLVIGEPRDDSPSWGWVKEMRVQGDELLANIEDTHPEVAKILADGLFQKRSIALYPDGSLKYLGLIGATPPGIPGLGRMNFKEGPYTHIEWEGGSFMGGKFEVIVERQRQLGEALHQKVVDLLNSGRRFDQFGSPISANLTYCEALRIVCRENVEEAQQYAEACRQIAGGR